MGYNVYLAEIRKKNDYREQVILISKDKLKKGIQIKTHNLEEDVLLANEVHK